MAESKHTPAPWTVVEGAQGYVDPEIGGDGMLSIEGGTAGSADWGENEQLALAVVLADVEPIASEAEANARLIAAAPDLLDALRGLLEVINDSSGVVDYRGNGNFAPWSDLLAFEAARDAIAKAEEATNG